MPHLGKFASIWNCEEEGDCGALLPYQGMRVRNMKEVLACEEGGSECGSILWPYQVVR